ncbi:hypothetical protein IWX90DRAFT_80767 [Phyllosticta citrichinensis]|uniref:Uncharacterized protein n=1 Tax=Phyllosticta citrichinensis TaxID=1130410 RepID=A0ABR1XG64_9PEZI
MLLSRYCFSMPGPQSQECSPRITRSRQEGNRKRSNIPLNNSRRNDLSDRKGKKKEEEETAISPEQSKKDWMHPRGASLSQKRAVLPPSKPRPERKTRESDDKKNKKGKGNCSMCKRPASSPWACSLRNHSPQPFYPKQTKERPTSKKDKRGERQRLLEMQQRRGTVYTHFWGLFFSEFESGLFFVLVGSLSFL